MSTKSSTTKSLNTKRNRPTGTSKREPTHRERIQAEIEQLERKVHTTRTSIDAAANSEEKKAYSTILASQQKTLDAKKAERDQIVEQSQKKNNEQSVLSAWRNAGKHMVSKTLHSQPDVYRQVINAMTNAAKDQSGIEGEKAFLSGVALGEQQIAKPPRKKKVKTTSEDDSDGQEEAECDAQPEEEDAQDAEANVEDEDQNEMDTSN